ncbi:hypothetical protein O0V02_16920 [Gordonia amicalis]|uniref:hypothetical protein n=1 Tax=Gordonia amicalis TaxID=89053 RepID=UPI0022A73F06|nr:hypothetical protein [Gordonia amicalis]MCZ0914082.1 hypothetical protein [Gordonia amicalis]
MSRLQNATTRLWLAVDQPTPDPGPFSAVWDKVGGILIWGATIGGLVAIVWGAVMFGWERLDPSREQKSGVAIICAVIGGVIAASAAQIINWSYGT